jgi:hypothetical protein
LKLERRRDVSENEAIDSDEAAAKRIATVMVSWNESGKSWREFVEGLRVAAEAATETYQIAVACVPPGGQLPLIPGAVAAPEPKKPRKERRVIMHDNGKGSFVCAKCVASEDIPAVATDAARKRGVPCPKCNAAAEA